MARIFLSHASQDAVLARTTSGWIEEAGHHDVFLDEDPENGIAVGDDWDARLLERLRWADVLICLISRAYCRSAWCAAEIAFARNRGTTIVPVAVATGLRHPLLSSVQHLDLEDGPRGRPDRLLAELRRLDARTRRSWADGRSPYPGLKAFEADRELVFFGREEDTTRLVETLRSSDQRADNPVRIIVGPSGCGKSSLVRAGLTPAIRAEPDAWAITPCAPGRDPLASLARQLARAGRELRRESHDVDESRSRRRVQQALAEDGLLAVVQDLLDLVPRASGEEPCARLLVTIDQFEELLTLAPPEGRAEFVDLVVPALQDGACQMAATLRPEFLDAVLADQPLARLPKRFEPLVPLSPSAIHRVITEPAALSGLRFDDRLVERLIEDAAGALPLLAFTLWKLTTGLGRGDTVSSERYEYIGKVTGALAQQAAHALEEARAVSGRDPDAIVRELLRLVVVDEEDRPARRRIDRRDLPETVSEELDAFVEARLLVTSRELGEDETLDPAPTYLEVAHETLFTAWEPLASAISSASKALRARRIVEDAAQGWTKRGRSKDGLWTGPQLDGVVADLQAHAPTFRRPGSAPFTSEAIDLSPTSRDFLLQSMRRARRRRARTVSVLSTMLAIAVGGAIYGLLQADAAAHQQRLAVARQFLATADASDTVNTRSALRAALASAQLDPAPAADTELATILAHTSLTSTVDNGAGVVSTAISPTGTILATGGINGQLRLWDISDPRRPRPIGGPVRAQRSYIYHLAFAPTGNLLAVAGADGDLRLWDTSVPEAPRPVGAPLVQNVPPLHGVAFAPTGSALAAVGFDGHLRLFDVQDPGRPTQVDQPVDTRQLYTVAYSPDGRLVATAGADHLVRLWAPGPSGLTPVGPALSGAANAVWSVAFSPDGATLAAVDEDGELATWATDGTGRSLLAPQRVHAGAAYSVAFAPDGTVLTGGADHVVFRFSLVDSTRLAELGEPLRGHDDQVYAVEPTRDGRFLVSGSRDGTVDVWNADGPPGLRPLPPLPPAAPGQALDALAMSRDDGPQRLATGGANGVVQTWDVSDAMHPRPTAASSPLPAAVRAVQFTPGSPTLAAATSAGTLAVLQVDTSSPGAPGRLEQIALAPATQGPAYALSPAPTAPRRLAVGGADRTVALWDVSDPTQPTRVGPPGMVHTDAVYSVAFSPDGRTVASGGQEGGVLTWAAGSDGLRDIRPGLDQGGAPIYALAFSPSGSALAAGGAEGTLEIWAPPVPGAPRHLLTPPIGTGAIDSIAFSPDGTLLAVGSSNGLLSIWSTSAPEGAKLLGSTSASAAINGLVFSRDGASISAALRDGSVGRWDASAYRGMSADPVGAGCAVAARGLDPAEWTAAAPGLRWERSCR